MAKKIGIGFILLAVLFSGLAVHNWYKDPWRVGNLIKTHPRLQEVCDLSGGCLYVDVDCIRYDYTGNSSLRGTTFVEITTGSAFGRRIYAQSFALPEDANPELIERAIDQFIVIANTPLREPEKHTVPNRIPCPLDCLK